MQDFSKRSLLPEKMDQPGVVATELQQALQELEVVNHWLGGYKVILNALGKITWDKKSVTILDLGCGGGDTLRVIADWASKNKRTVNLIGVDRNPVMISYASKKSVAYNNISFRTMDVFDNLLLQERPDIVITSQFCHHFENRELVELVKKMQLLASKAVFINDLHRNWFAYYAIKLITAVVSKSYLVKYDGPLSVARSLKKNEWLRVLEQAGARNYQIKWMWAWRWQIIIEKF